MAKKNFDNIVSSLSNKISANKAKSESVENELKKLKTFVSSYFISKIHFEEDGTQIYLLFQPIKGYFKIKLIQNIFYRRNLKDYLTKLLSLLLHLIIVLLH